MAITIINLNSTLALINNKHGIITKNSNFNFHGKQHVEQHHYEQR